MNPSWRQRAACRRSSLPDNAWFPNLKGGLPDDSAEALALCQHCPVRDHCERAANRTASQGIWAGKVRVATNDWRTGYIDDPRFVRVGTRRQP